MLWFDGKSISNLQSYPYQYWKFFTIFLNCYNWIQRLYVKTTTLKKQGSNSKCPFSSLQSSREIINATIWVSYFNMFGNYRQVILPRVGFIMRCLKCGHGTIKKDWIFPWKIGNWVSGTFQLLPMNRFKFTLIRGHNGLKLEK